MSSERLTTDPNQVRVLDPATIGTLRFPLSTTELTSGRPSMRFVCDSCRAQYMISDDKVGAKGVKVRCKKCGYVILVRRAAGSAPAPVAAPPAPPAALGDEQDSTATQVMDNPLGNLSRPAQNFDPDTTSPSIAVDTRSNGSHSVFGSAVPEDEISSVFDQVLNTGVNRVPDQKADGSGGEALGDQSDDRMSTRILDADTVQKLAAESQGEGKNGEAKNGEAHNDWFVAVDEKQVGPLNIDKIKAMWDRGEIGPDSLCWRAGFSDWTALSEVGELATMLAPKPQKPVIVAPSAVGIPSVVTVPVESAFSAGGVTRTVRSEMPMLAGAQPEAGWRPSAASALQSLVKEEIEALTKPAPKAAASPMVMDDKPKAQPSAGLLDLPEATPAVSNGKAAAAVAQAAQQFAQPFQAQYPIYRPPDDSSKKLILIGGIVAAVLLMALVGLVGYLMASKNNQVAAVSAPVVEKTPVAAEAPKVVAPAPAPGAQAQTPPPAPAPAQANPATPAPSNQVQPPPPSHTGRTNSSGSDTHHDRQSGGDSHASSSSHTAHSDTPEASPPKHEKKEDAEDEFASTFGDKKKVASREAPSDATPKKSKDVYIPPAPGAGGDIPDAVGQGDIMATVVSQKPAIIDCVNKQKAKDPEAHGTLVMRWTIQTSGRTSGITVASEEFKTTYLANCMSGLIKNWSFPKHKNSQDPISFPFKF
jgi:predicted Zn finger-like uncharacterized protein